MRLRLFCLALALSGACLAAAPALAADCGARVTQMPDGRYLNLDTGLTAATCQEAGGPAAPPLPIDGTSAPSIPVVPPVVSASSTVEAATSTAPVGFSLKDAILRGRALLKQKLDGEYAVLKKPKTVPSLTTPVTVTLAVWDGQTDEVRLVDVKKSGAKVTDADAELDVTIRRSNGVNTEYGFKGDDRHVVVAIEGPIYKEVRLSRRKRAYQLQDVVYTPYADTLRTDEIVAWGRSTLEGDIKAAYDGLRQGAVMSRAFPGRPVVDVIDPRLAESIIFIEHLGSRVLGGPDAQAAVDRFYVVMGLNQEAAFSYSNSTAGARGLVQFIPSTYKLMTKRSDLALVADFEQGMSDPVNAIKAEVAYLDSELADMPSSVKDLASTDPALADAYVAAAYNGGGARVRKAIAAFGDGWAADGAAKIAEMRAERAKVKSDIAALRSKAKKADAKKLKQIKAQIAADKKLDADWVDRIEAAKKAVLKPETADYVRKFRSMLALLGGPTPVTATVAQL